jgi:hypothetical protein
MSVAPSGQIIEHDLLSLEEGVNPVAANVAGAAGDQDGHVAGAITLVCLPRRKIRPDVNARVRAR